MRPTCSVARLLASAAVAAIVAAGLGGCQTVSDITGSISSRPDTKPDTSANADPQRGAEAYGDRYRANPKDPDAALAYGQALRANGQQAFDVLSHAHSPENPDWRILSVQGAALDQLGRHDDARRYYASALKIVPGEPSVLSNLGLSYM